jgi:hypothetical protein
MPIFDKRLSIMRPDLNFMRYITLTILFALSTLPYALFAQYFTLGTDPSSVKWSQVKTKHFKVIYPDDMDTQALHVANALEYFRGPATASLGSKPGKWPVVLHGSSAYSNAVTPYAPKRIDMLTTPPQDNYPQDWLDQLVIHEFRHSAQYAALNHGFTKTMTYVFGQQALPAVMGLFVPFWFIEGDAVAIETATSQTGRGRVPSFEMKLRAQFLEKGIFSYDKAYNGSYKDFIPDWYELGYLLVGHTRVKYGSDTWSNVMRKTGNMPFMLVPFSNTLYKETGFGKSRLYDTITSELKLSWLNDDSGRSISPFEPLMTNRDKFYTNRTQPSVLDDGRVIAIKSSIDDITRIVAVDSSGSESILLNPGYIIDEGLSASSNLVCWAEMDADPRWSLRSYSVIMLHDLQTGKTRQITAKNRFFAPSLDFNGKKIAAVEIGEAEKYSLVILNSENGEVIHRFPTPENYFPSFPAWSSDGEKIAVILTRDEGKCIALMEPATGKYEIVLPFSNVEISKPCFFGDYLLFTSAYTGIDNIFALDLNTKKLFQVTSARFGATDPAVSPDGKKLYYSNYTANGYKIVSSALNPGTIEQWNNRTIEPWNPANNHKYELAEQLAAQENFIFKSAYIPDSAYTIKRYRKGLNLFNFHSWAPLSVDIDHTELNPGITLLSQNLLGTSFTTLGYEYNMNEKTGKYSVKYSYEGWYPAIDLQADYGLRRGLHKDSIYYDYDELNLSAWVRVPLGWNVKSWFVGMQPYAGYSYELQKMNPGMEVRFRKDRFSSLNTKLYFYAQSRMSERDLAPRWGQSLDLNFRHTLFEADTASSIFATELSLYFPGIVKHHSFYIYGGYQERVMKYYPYSDQILIARGFSGIYAGSMFTGSVNYEFPVLCPDWHIGPVLYLKRLKAGLFFDHTLTFDHEPYQNYNSIGLDLTFDFHLFRLFAPLEAGLRTVYFPESGTVGFEFLYSLNLSY